jgi:hypothetical protein
MADLKQSKPKSEMVRVAVVEAAVTSNFACHMLLCVERTNSSLWLRITRRSEMKRLSASKIIATGVLLLIPILRHLNRLDKTSDGGSLRPRQLANCNPGRNGRRLLPCRPLKCPGWVPVSYRPDGLQDEVATALLL